MTGVWGELAQTSCPHVFAISPLCVWRLFGILEYQDAISADFSVHISLPVCCTRNIRATSTDVFVQLSPPTHLANCVRSSGKDQLGAGNYLYFG